jgi:beta-lactamase class A
MRAPRFNWFFLFSGFSLIAAFALLTWETFRYSQSFTQLPVGLRLAGVPVGGLTTEAALQQIATTYAAPVELRYRDSSILLDPAFVSFQVNTTVLLPQAAQLRSNDVFWSGLWDYLWLRPASAEDVPLRATYSQERLRAFLADVAARYDQPGSPPQADASALGFQPGEPGYTLNLEAAVDLVDKALFAAEAERRIVTLPVVEQTIIRPNFETLNELIEANAAQYQFNGVLSLFLSDLEVGDELNLTLSNNQPITGPVAFSGLSTIKIPIMASFFARNQGALTDDERLLLQRSMEESQNTATDLLLRTIGRGDGFAGALAVTDDMRRLGLENTYISGLLDVRGAVLTPFATLANSRGDINLNPDPYNQTTAEEMGLLLAMIHHCTRGGGALIAAFPGAFTPEECQEMVSFLSQNQVGPIFIAGGSPGGVVAHKHGWDTVPLTNVADAALVFTPGGDYALTIFLNQAETIGYEDANRLLISMARAVYNFYNK